jgi:hypothetical protein
MNWLSNVLGAEWLAGFITGVAATILGFVLTILWDINKAKRESIEKDKAVIKAINEELLSNKKCLEQNLERLQTELDILNKGKNIVQPLFILKTGFWELAKVQFPRTLLRGNRLVSLRSIVFYAEQANEEIRSRENYRIHNEAMSNFHHRMHLYDESIGGVLRLLAAEMAVFENEINNESGIGLLSHLFHLKKSYTKKNA